MPHHMENGGWIPEPLGLFMSRETIDRVLGNIHERTPDTLQDVQMDTPSAIRVGIRHRYNYLIFMDEEYPRSDLFSTNFAKNMIAIF